MSDITNFVRRSGSSNRDDINKLLSLVSNFFFSDPEEGALKERIEFSPQIRKRTTSVTTGFPNAIESETKNIQVKVAYNRKIPTTVTAYDLVHNTTNSITIPRTSMKFGAGGHGSGTGYITVTDHANLTSDTLTLALWIYPKATSGDGLIISKNNEYQLKSESGNVLRFRTYSGGAWRTGLTYTFTSNIDTWISVICTYNSASGHNLYINNVSQGTDAITGSITGTSNDLKIFGDGTSNLPTLFKLSWLNITNAVQDSTWRGKYHTDQLIDYSTDTNITIIPFMGDESAEPLASAGLFQAS
jgi:hypothetical protein